MRCTEISRSSLTLVTVRIQLIVSVVVSLLLVGVEGENME
jgi:hypothetical protein